jgi:hypothetical protein
MSVANSIQISLPAELREIDFSKLQAITAIPEDERYAHAASMDLKTLGRFIQPAIDCAEALVAAYRPYLINFRERTAHQGEQKLLIDGSGKSVSRDELCRQTIGVGIRRLNQLLRVTDPDAPAATKNEDPPLAIGAEVIVTDNGHPAVVVHQNVTVDRVDVDETFPNAEQTVRKSYKRSELVPLSEWLAQQKKQECKDEAIEDGLAPEYDPPAEPKPTCKKCVKLEAKIKTLEERNATLIETHKKKVEELKKSLDDLRAEMKRKIAELKGKKLDDSAAKLDTKQAGVRVVGDKSEPHAGLYWEFRKAEKPYGIRSVDYPELSVLCECKSETEAIAKIREYAADPTIVGKAASA